MDYVLVCKPQHEIIPDTRLLDAGEQTRYQRLRSPQKQLEFLTGRTLLKQELATYLGVAARSVFLATTTTGKPYLPAVYGSQRPHFSLSHANGWYGVGVAARPIGIDLEAKQNIDVTLFQHVLTQEERKALLTVPESIRSDRFLRLFTAKEAFLKATDKRWSLSEIQFVPDGAAWRLHLPAEPYQFYQLEEPNYWLTVCLQMMP
ncbi:4'-phosphopantetheinyl transferase superfamily protein [Spirosoma knui]